MAHSDLHIPVHGWLALDKPLGLTSTQALGRARRLLAGKKAGHGGTLDPLATGLLPLAFGEATKLIPYVMDGSKEYEFTVRWGENRSTCDSEGNVTARSEARPDEAQIRAVLPSFIGDIMQKPPAFSAIKVQGERAYDLARAGKTVDLAPREVRIETIELLGIPDADHASFRVLCGKGVYVRALARDFAAALGTFGYVSALRRTRVGPFGIENAVSMADLERLSAKNAAKEALLPIKAALGAIPTLVLTPNEAHSLKMGQKILIKPQNQALLDATLVFAEYDRMPVAIVEPVAGEFRVVRGFHF
ncbi:MAG: tRNA pseudouridine(55) synthase TruB [Alphaproteobacteria bacterium]|nr:tRNA pseudouridine(55) synthase TruB [Alphaproteobacteria bacterium]